MWTVVENSVVCQYGAFLFLSSSILMVDVVDGFLREFFFLPFYSFAVVNDVS